MLTDIDKDIPNITEDSLWQRSLVCRSPHLHEQLESPVLHYFEGPLTLGHPTDNFSPTSIQNEAEANYQR